MSRIDRRFAELAENGRKALIPYLVAGDPGLDSTVPLMHALVDGGSFTKDDIRRFRELLEDSSTGKRRPGSRRSSR